jgi:hypothetical protein
VCAHLRRQLLAALQHCDRLAGAGRLPRPVTHVVVCGGVAANAIIRASVQATAAEWSDARAKRGLQPVRGRARGSTPHAAGGAELPAAAAATRHGAARQELPQAQAPSLFPAGTGSAAAVQESPPPLPQPLPQPALPVTALFPPPALCTDNGVMVAWAAAEILASAASADVVASAAAVAATGPATSAAGSAAAPAPPAGRASCASAPSDPQPGLLRHRVIDPNTPDGLTALQQLRSQPRWPLGGLR